MTSRRAAMIAACSDARLFDGLAPRCGPHFRQPRLAVARADIGWPSGLPITLHRLAGSVSGTSGNTSRKQQQLMTGGAL
jgi:hypothetical protein